MAPNFFGQKEEYSRKTMILWSCVALVSLLCPIFVSLCRETQTDTKHAEPTAFAVNSKY